MKDLFESALMRDTNLPENPLFWDTEGVKDWLLSVDDGRFKCYVDVLFEHMITGTW